MKRRPISLSPGQSNKVKTSISVGSPCSVSMECDDYFFFYFLKEIPVKLFDKLETPDVCEHFYKVLIVKKKSLHC